MSCWTDVKKRTGLPNMQALSMLHTDYPLIHFTLWMDLFLGFCIFLLSKTSNYNTFWRAAIRLLDTWAPHIGRTRTILKFNSIPHPLRILSLILMFFSYLVPMNPICLAFLPSISLLIICKTVCMWS